MLTDALALGPGNEGHRLGAGAPHLLIRTVACVDGAAEVGMSYEPRPEYGLLRPILSHVDGGVTARGGAEWLVLSTPVPLRIVGSTATARLALTRRVTPSASPCTARRWRRQPARVWPDDEIAERLAGDGRGLAVVVGPAPGRTTGRGGTWCTTAAGCCTA